MGALERLYPGIGHLIEQGEINIPGQGEWYTIEKAKQLLGYAPRFAFEMASDPKEAARCD